MSQYTMTQEDYTKLLRYVNEKPTFARFIGVELTKVDQDYCEGVLHLSQENLNYLGIVHGGGMATLADTVSGIAACTRGQGVVTLNYEFNFHRPGTGSIIRCVATPVKTGRHISIFHCALTGDSGELVASGAFTFYMTDQNIMDEVNAYLSQQEQAD